MGMRAATEGQKVHSTDAPGPPEARACSTFSPHGAESPAAQRLLPVTEALSPFLLRRRKGGIRPQDWSVAVATLPTDTEGLGRPGRRGGVLVVVGRARWAELAWEPQDRAHRHLQGKGLQGSSA